MSLSSSDADPQFLMGRKLIDSILQSRLTALGTLPSAATISFLATEIVKLDFQIPGSRR